MPERLNAEEQRFLEQGARREAKTWKDLAQAAFKKQLASKEKTPVSEGLSSTDRSPVRENGLTKA